ncbi:hypothetical protein [Arthrobacter sp. VKM Ac-2550]|uniref:hypothetical protein n=1 Tax=Crystallibacter permensis TaxID=1938888 RepID=UPI0022274BCA|nr:hypothetical protein [Arthrobacter sp. VKM Ac-2550]MCW2135132.1 hypothetical protein [Arthrobacter sp. VKM Ac-2550]
MPAARPNRRLRSVAALAVAGITLSGCGLLDLAPEAGAAGGAAAPPAQAAPPSSMTMPRPSAEPSWTAKEGWKTYTDPAGTLSFDLPEDWTVQQQPEPTQPANGGVHLDISDGGGRVVAQLHTRLILEEIQCTPGNVTDYVVLASEPLDVAAVDGTGNIEPRFVFRMLRGYKFFASMGITNKVGGVDNKACAIQNAVAGPESVGLYSFSDTPVHGVPSADEPAGELKSYDSVQEALEYLETDRFAKLREMITSLRIAEQAAAASSQRERS